MVRSSKFLPTADSYLFMGKFLGDLLVIRIPSENLRLCHTLSIIRDSMVYL